MAREVAKHTGRDHVHFGRLGSRFTDDQTDQRVSRHRICVDDAVVEPKLAERHVRRLVGAAVCLPATDEGLEVVEAQTRTPAEQDRRRSTLDDCDHGVDIEAVLTEERLKFCDACSAKLGGIEAS
jgi:hypothetical protein